MLRPGRQSKYVYYVLPLAYPSTRGRPARVTFLCAAAALRGDSGSLAEIIVVTLAFPPPLSLRGVGARCTFRNTIEASVKGLLHFFMSRYLHEPAQSHSKEWSGEPLYLDVCSGLLPRP